MFWILQVIIHMIVLQNLIFGMHMAVTFKEVMRHYVWPKLNFRQMSMQTLKWIV